MTTLSEFLLRKLIQGGETTAVEELKAAAPRPVEMAERLCGMANGQGGMVIIGVEDSQHKVIRVPDERMAVTIDNILRATRLNIKPSLVLDPPEPEVYVLDRETIVVVTVPPSYRPIYQSGGVCWVLHGTHTVPLSVSEMLEMANDRGLRDWELQLACDTTIDDTDMEKVEAYLQQRLTRDRNISRFEDKEKVLLGMKCALVTSNGNVIPTNAGILFFGYDPQLHIMQSEVVCVLFRETVGASRYADRRIITGTLQELIDGAEALYTRRSISL